MYVESEAAFGVRREQISAARRNEPITVAVPHPMITSERGDDMRRTRLCRRRYMMLVRAAGSARHCIPGERELPANPHSFLHVLLTDVTITTY